MIGSKAQRVAICLLLGFGGGLALRSLTREAAPAASQDAHRARPRRAPPRARVDLAALIAERDRLSEALRAAEERFAAKRRAMKQAEERRSVAARAGTIDSLAQRWRALILASNRLREPQPPGQDRPEPGVSKEALLSFIEDCLSEPEAAFALVLAQLDAAEVSQGDLDLAFHLGRLLTPDREQQLALGTALIRLLGRLEDKELARYLATAMPLSRDDPRPEFIDELLAVARQSGDLPGSSYALFVLSRLKSPRAQAPLVEIIATRARPDRLRAAILVRLDLESLEDPAASLLRLTEEPSLRDRAFARLAELSPSARVRTEAERAFRSAQASGVGGGLFAALAIHGDARTRDLLERFSGDPRYSNAQREKASKAAAGIRARLATAAREAAKGPP